MEIQLTEVMNIELWRKGYERDILDYFRNAGLPGRLCQPATEEVFCRFRKLINADKILSVSIKRCIRDIAETVFHEEMDSLLSSVEYIGKEHHFICKDIQHKKEKINPDKRFWEVFAKVQKAEDTPPNRAS